NLYLNASARWNDCRDQWLALMAQNPQAPLTANWWQARARGTDLSRKAQAIRLYRQHFEASCQMAFAQGTLNAEQLNVLLDLVNAAAQTTSPEILVYVETLSIRGSSGLTDELPGALVITRNTDQPVTQLLYLPSRQAPWMTFENRSGLERWLTQQQPEPEGSRVTVD
ncbi:MAG: dermonecrotic toxin domain-containing protein, partial [Pseudomonas sp.]